ncbi:MAG: Elongation factor P--(R)-beta-lysine ligase [Chlamydiales bacterium]|nr:Elongation factor P--(R)-beta-lysine ligase [Chlamydiales bacterium]MCH9619852.1 Elongation factor P--(R)-beta-lysine ligase [Chlamydiales bacterium]MCH9622721.1 Elongation factor P--(R)-beta-lysine ligase [Chlamydiales bacterium]
MSLAQQANKIERLRERAQMMGSVRSFFSQRDVLEVDVPMLSKSGPIDAHIDLVTGSCCGTRSYLHSSPEYGMKRLLAQGVGDCYQLGHVFRDFESGERHNPEFTMVEWYRCGFTLEELIEESAQLISLFLGEKTYRILPYEEAFYTYAKHFPSSIDKRDTLFADEVEPKLEGLVFLIDYPPEQACLAKTCVKEEEVVAERFEVFYNGVELGNGYHELANRLELKERLMVANEQRLRLGKERYPLDEYFLEASIPDCCGVAIGFDRLMMLKTAALHIEEVIPFHWDET